MAVLDSSLRERKVSSPSRSRPGQQVDQMANEFQAVRVSVDDLSSRLASWSGPWWIWEHHEGDLLAPGSPGAPASGGPPQGLSADALYANAMRDKDGGNSDMALQEFGDYLKYYRDTDTAPNAQYYVGEISTTARTTRRL